jgi:hypothetical protein
MTRLAMNTTRILKGHGRASMADFWTSEDADFLFVSETQQVDKDCYIVVQCISSASKDVKFPTLKYSTNGVDFFNCTDLFPGEGEDIANGVTASPAGTNHTFAWDSDTDLGGAFDGSVKLKFGVKNEDDTGNETTITGNWFTLDFAAPVCSVDWPDGEIIGDATPILQRNATDSSGPILTEWVIDDDPLFGDANGRQQTKAYSSDTTFQTAGLGALGTWYFKIRCKDSSPSANESAWDESGEFALLLAFKPHSLTDGVDTIQFIVDEVAMALVNRLREYEADGDGNAGGANIVEWVQRKAMRVMLRLIDGPDPSSGNFEQYEQSMTWWRAQTLLDLEDIGGSPVTLGGSNISYTPNDWVIVSIRIINRPMRKNLLYYEVTLEEV